MHRLSTYYSVLFLFTFVLGIGTTSVLAENSTFTVATSYEVEGLDIQKGMIVTNDGNNITTSKTAYDPNIFGIITERPAISLGNKSNGEGSYPVATTGKVPVLVSNINGTITKGDYITSSTTEGIGMKASVPGRVVGIALEGTNEETVGNMLIMISLNSENASSTAIERSGSLTGSGDEFGDTAEEPYFLSYVKFISSGLIAVISFTGGLIYYIQIAKKEVEALGRNPLASQTIQKNMFMHGIVVALMCLGGLLMSYAVLQL